MAVFSAMEIRVEEAALAGQERMGAPEAMAGMALMAITVTMALMAVTELTALAV